MEEENFSEEKNSGENFSEEGKTSEEKISASKNIFDEYDDENIKEHINKILAGESVSGKNYRVCKWDLSHKSRGQKFTCSFPQHDYILGIDLVCEGCSDSIIHACLTANGRIVKKLNLRRVVSDNEEVYRYDIIQDPFPFRLAHFQDVRLYVPYKISKCAFYIYNSTVKSPPYDTRNTYMWQNLKIRDGCLG